MTRRHIVLQKIGRIVPIHIWPGAWLRIGAMLLLLGVLLGIGGGGLSSCASQSAPSGGPRDTLAPSLLTTYPPRFSTQFEGSSIKLVFDEFLRLQGASQQVRISPPLPEGVEVTGRGKEVEVSWKDSLKAQTTYIISFGESIKDLNEGNVNDTIRYVFSTGDYIDSLALSGVIHDAFTGEAAKDMMVGLYRLDSTSRLDSMLYKDLPDYYAPLTETGDFQLSNLKKGAYRLVAFRDANQDFLLDQPHTPMAFWPDTIDLRADSLYRYSLRSYAGRAEQKFFGLRAVAAGKFQLAFKRSVDSLELKTIPPVAADSGFLEREERADTLFYWYRGSRDSLQFHLSYAQGDTDLTASRWPGRAKSLGIVFPQKELTFRDSLFLELSEPLASLDSSALLLQGKDTLQPRLQQMPGPSRTYWLAPRKKEYRLILDQGAFQGWSGAVNDSTAELIKVASGKDLGALEFTVVADSSGAYRIQLYQENGTLIQAQNFWGRTTLNLPYLRPGKLKAYLIRDSNEDGRWTPGNFWKNRLPEKRIPYKEELEIRPNWEQSIEWRLE